MSSEPISSFVESLLGRDRVPGASSSRPKASTLPRARSVAAGSAGNTSQPGSLKPRKQAGESKTSVRTPPDPSGGGPAISGRQGAQPGAGRSDVLAGMSGEEQGAASTMDHPATSDDARSFQLPPAPASAGPARISHVGLGAGGVTRVGTSSVQAAAAAGAGAGWLDGDPFEVQMDATPSSSRGFIEQTKVRHSQHSRRQSDPD